MHIVETRTSWPIPTHDSEELDKLQCLLIRRGPEAQCSRVERPWAWTHSDWASTSSAIHQRMTLGRGLSNYPSPQWASQCLPHELVERVNVVVEVKHSAPNKHITLLLCLWFFRFCYRAKDGFRFRFVIIHSSPVKMMPLLIVCYTCLRHNHCKLLCLQFIFVQQSLFYLFYLSS